MKTVLRYVGLYLNFVTPYLGTFIFFGKVIDYFRFVFSVAFIVALAVFEHVFLNNDNLVAVIIFVLGAIFIIILFVHSVYMLIKYENEYNFYWFEFIGRVAVALIPTIAATLILGELGWFG